MDGHIVTFRSNYLVNAPLSHRDLLMLRFFFIRDLRMAGEDILEKSDTDDEVSSLAATSAGSAEEQTVSELA